ncbi:MAG: hypothetical protein HGB11_15135 [Chlorobiales bacterium]|nr:hypothetical protein [Chlorobiales bacterium]
MTRFFSLAALAFFLIACAQSKPAQAVKPAPSRPDWVDGKSIKYPDGLYLTGVGSSSSRELAENTARANVAKIFKVDLSAVTSTTTTENIINKQDSQLQEKTYARVDASIKKTIEGTVIEEVWRDIESNRYYALAVLDRDMAASIFKARINEIDKEFGETKSLALSTSDKLEKIRAFVRLKTLLKTRETVNTDLRVVDDNNQGIAPPYSPGKENAEITRFLTNEVLLGIRNENGTPDRIIRSLMDDITKRGLTVKPVTPNSQNNFDIIFDLGLNLEPSNEKMDGWYFCRWSLNMSALDPRSDASLANESRTGRSGQLTVDRSKDKATTDAQKSLRDVSTVILNGLFGE